MGNLLKVLVIFSLLTAIQFQKSFANDHVAHRGACHEAIHHHTHEPEKGLLERYIADAERRIAVSGSKRPEFIDAYEDRERVRTMTGIKGPYLFSQALPDNAYFIDHPSYLPDEPGVVKSSTSGETVPLRVVVDYKGRKIGTNVIFLRNALYDNLHREKKSLVPEKADAVVLWMHGGGTNSTGNHVGIGPANHFGHYNVATVAMDMPWHGEGPREYFTDNEDFLGWVRAFITQFAKVEGIPILIAGHSMGGEFADMYMRTYPNDDLAAGVIALSPPVDPIPGGTVLDRLVQNAKGYTAEVEMPEEVAEETHSLLHGLMIDGKTSPMGLYFETQISAHNDWKIPEDRGQSFLPALFVWGEIDYLYWGREKHIEDYVKALPNVEFKTYGERTLIDGQRKKIGHIIFDHYRESDDPNLHELEAFADIRDFISKVIGKKLVRKKEPVDHKKTNFLNAIQDYAYNFAYREFVGQMQVTKRIQRDQEALDSLNTEIHQVNKDMGSTKGSEKSVIKAQYDELQAKRAGKYIPNGPEGDEGRNLEAKINQISNDVVAAGRELKEIKSKIEILAREIKAMKKKFASSLKIAAEKYPISAQLVEEYKRAEAELEVATAALEQAMYQRHIEVFSKITKPTEVDLELPPELNQFFKNYRVVEYATFARKRATFNREISYLAEKGKFNASLKDEFERISSSEAQLRVLLDIERLLQQIVVNAAVQSENMRAQIVERYNGQLWRIDSYSLEHILQSDYDGFSANTAALQEFRRLWINLWSDRPPVEKASIY